MCSGGGDQTAKQSEKASANFQTTLTDIYKQQYGQQSAILNFLTNSLEPQIEHPQGYDAATMAAMNTNAVDTTANQYANAKKALQNTQALNGSREVGSGVDEANMGAMDMGQASDTASALQNVQVQNQNLKNQNYWNAISALSGNAQTINPNSTASNANGAGSTVAGLSQAYTASNQSQLLGALGGVAGGVGAALSGRITHS